MRSDSPSPEWYEPADLLDDDDEVLVGPQLETLTISFGVVHWTAAAPTTEA